MSRNTISIDNGKSMCVVSLFDVLSGNHCIGELNPCFAVDVQASRLAPGRKGCRINIDLFDHKPLTYKRLKHFLRSVKPFFVGVV